VLADSPAYARAIVLAFTFVLIYTDTLFVCRPSIRR